MEPANRLAKIFADLGFDKPKPSEALLKQWGMTTYRFNQLVGNRAVSPMTVSEMNNIKAWLKAKFKGNNIFLFESELHAYGDKTAQQTQLPLN